MERWKADKLEACRLATKAYTKEKGQTLCLKQGEGKDRHQAITCTLTNIHTHHMHIIEKKEGRQRGRDWWGRQTDKTKLFLENRRREVIYVGVPGVGVGVD